MILLGPCEMCGASVELATAIVEGSMLHVCPRCAQFGNVIPVTESVEIPTQRRNIVIEEPVDFVIENAGRLVKEAREQRGLKQSQLGKMVGEKESVIQKIENSGLVPTITTAKKFERILDIRLIEQYHEPEKTNTLDLGSKNLTIGDLVKLKKKV